MEYSSSQHASLLWELMPYGITQCYLPPGKGDIPTLTPAEAVSTIDLLIACGLMYALDR